MFELLQAYETANNEKNKVLRFFYLKHVRKTLKKTFFKPFKDSICNMTLDKALLDEFSQFYQCTNHDVYTGLNKEEPNLHYLLENIFYIFYNEAYIRYKFMENNCDIDIEFATGYTVSTHPENEVFYTSILATIILMAIYNYCVSYIYGKNNELYISDNSYIETIKSMY